MCVQCAQLSYTIRRYESSDIPSYPPQIQRTDASDHASHRSVAQCKSYLLCLEFPDKISIFAVLKQWLFNKRELTLFAVARPSVCLSSVTFMRPTQAVQIFGNISTALGTLAIHRQLTSIENFTEIVPGNPSAAGGVKHKRGSQV